MVSDKRFLEIVFEFENKMSFALSASKTILRLKSVSEWC